VPPFFFDEPRRWARRERCAFAHLHLLRIALYAAWQLRAKAGLSVFARRGALAVSFAEPHSPPRSHVIQRHRGPRLLESIEPASILRDIRPGNVDDGIQ